MLLSAISQQTGLTDDQTGSALGRLVMTPRYQNAAYYLINRAMHLMTAAAMRDLVRTETTYDARAGDQLIEQVLSDPAQKQQVLAMADAMVPALPRFAGVMNDLDVQRRLEPLPFGDIQAPTLVVGSRFDGDIGYENSTNAHERIAGSELVTVDQFGHLIWWGDSDVTRGFQQRIEQFLRAHS